MGRPAREHVAGDRTRARTAEDGDVGGRVSYWGASTQHDERGGVDGEHGAGRASERARWHGRAAPADKRTRPRRPGRASERTGRPASVDEHEEGSDEHFRFHLGLEITGFFPTVRWSFLLASIQE